MGTGTSTGIPMLGCQCPVCTHLDVRNQRLRVSAWLQTAAGNSVLIDATPDFRTQGLRYQIRHLDGAIVTHDHADHTHGLDDLRPLCHVAKTKSKSIPIFTGAQCAESLKRRFPYIFLRDQVFHEKHPILGGGIPKLDLHLVESKGESTLLGEKFYFFDLPHGHINTLGFYHLGLAYLIDCNDIADEVVEFLNKKSVQVLIIDCVKYTPHQTHLHLQAAFDFIRRINPKQAYLVHMSHDMEHTRLTQECLGQFPAGNVLPAFDGLMCEY